MEQCEVNVSSFGNNHVSPSIFKWREWHAFNIPNNNNSVEPLFAQQLYAAFNEQYNHVLHVATSIIIIIIYRYHHVTQWRRKQFPNGGAIYIVQLDKSSLLGKEPPPLPTPLQLYTHTHTHTTHTHHTHALTHTHTRTHTHTHALTHTTHTHSHTLTHALTRTHTHSHTPHTHTHTHSHMHTPHTHHTCTYLQQLQQHCIEIDTRAAE